MINWHPKGASGWNQLHFAASSGDLSSLKTCIAASKKDNDDAKLQISKKRESKLDIPTNSGDRAFHIALRKGKSLAARALAEAGCDVKALGMRGENALHIAASRGLISELQWLMDSYGLDVHALTKNGSTCVHMAAEENRCDTLRELHALGVKLDVQNDNGDTALHLAARTGSVGAITWLIEKDSSLIRKLNKAGKDAETVARDAGRVEAAQELSAAKNVRKKITKGVIDFQKLVARGEDLFSVKDFIESTPGADISVLVDTVNIKTGTNAFLEACTGGNVEVVNYLFSLPGKREIQNAKTGATALQLAAARGHLSVVRFLLDELELDPSRADAKGTTALAEATKAGFTEIIKLFKEYVEKRQQSIRKSSSVNNLADMAPVSAPTHLMAPRQGSNVSELSSSPSTSSLLQRNVSVPTFEQPDSELISLLERVKLSPSYAAKLAEEGFGTISNLLHIVEQDLIQMGMLKGHRRALLHELDLIKSDRRQQQQSRPSSAPPPTNTDAKIEQKGSVNLTANDLAATQRQPIQIYANELGKSHPLDFVDGLQVEIIEKSAGSGPKAICALKRDGPVFSCTCSEWSFQSDVPQERRTCEHLKLLRGEDTERARVSDMPQRIETLRKSRSSGSSRSKGELEMFPNQFIVDQKELIIERDIIGEGSYGVVRIATWRGMRVAVKVLKVNASVSVSRHDDESIETDLKREAITMARVCNHENVVPLVGMVLEPVPSVIMAFMPGGSVEDLLVLPGPRSIRKLIPWYAVLKMLRDAAAGVLHLHCQGVIHRDLSARNLLVDITGAVRVADFGFARIKEENYSQGYTLSHVGPIKWMSPEALRLRRFSEKSDVFALGVTMWEILEGQRPWPGVESMDVVYRVCSGNRMSLPRSGDPRISQLVEQCWAQEDTKRPSMKEVFSLLDTAWIDAGGSTQKDLSGGVADLIKSERFRGNQAVLPEEQIANPNPHYWQNDKNAVSPTDDDYTQIKGKPSFNLSESRWASASDEKFESDGYVNFFA